MEKFCEKKSKRASFNETDTKLLVKCIDKRDKIFNNKKANGITPAMKRKVKFFNVKIKTVV